jgi:hypothetical protein
LSRRRFQRFIVKRFLPLGKGEYLISHATHALIKKFAPRKLKHNTVMRISNEMDFYEQLDADHALQDLAGRQRLWRPNFSNR